MKYFYLVTMVLIMIITSCTPKDTQTPGTGSSEEIVTGIIETNNSSAAFVTTFKPLREIPDNAPQFVRDAAENAPNDAFVGIGTARSASLSMARTTAATRARADISRQIDTTVENSEDGTVILTVSKAELTDSKIIGEDLDDEGNYWVVVMMINNKDL